MPTDPPELESIALLIPTTSPLILNNGPPEFPWFIEASVWIKSSYLPRLISLFLADIIPAVTVPPNPKGFPIATTQSPTLALSESANVTAFKLSFVFSLISSYFFRRRCSSVHQTSFLLSVQAC